MRPGRDSIEGLPPLRPVPATTSLKSLSRIEVGQIIWFTERRSGGRDKANDDLRAGRK